jgi:hypothetical protein
MPIAHMRFSAQFVTVRHCGKTGSVGVGKALEDTIVVLDSTALDDVTVVLESTALDDATVVLESMALEVDAMALEEVWLDDTGVEATALSNVEEPTNELDGVGLGVLLGSGVEEEIRLDSDDVVANTTDDVLEETTEGKALEDTSEETTIELTELEDTGVEEIGAAVDELDIEEESRTELEEDRGLEIEEADVDVARSAEEVEEIRADDVDTRAELEDT